MAVALSACGGDDDDDTFSVGFRFEPYDASLEGESEEFEKDLAEVTDFFGAYDDKAELVSTMGAPSWANSFWARLKADSDFCDNATEWLGGRRYISWVSCELVTPTPASERQY